MVRRVAPSCCTGISTAEETAPTHATAIASAPSYRYDVGLDANEYKPVSRDQILSFFGL